MLLYHGSNTVVEKPKLLPLARALDFGAGFCFKAALATLGFREVRSP